MVLGERSRLIDRALLLERVVETAHDGRHASAIAAINRGEHLAASLLNLRKDKTIFASFKKIIEQMGISIDVKCKNG